MSKQTKYFVYICALLPLLFLGNTGTVLAIEIESSSQTLTTETMNETSASNTSTTDSTSTVSSDAEGASNTSSSEKSSQESTKEETQASDESQQETQEEPEKIYDVQGGLDPSSRNRSDLKEQVGIQRRSLRSADVAFIEAGDPSTPSQDFIDVSSHNGIISVEQYKIIKSYGISSVVVKLTEATSYRNPLAASQIANAQAAGLVVHAYHYSWFTTEAQAKAEAEYFVKYAKELKLPTSALMVNDIEDNQIMGKADHTALSKVFANRIKELGYSNIPIITLGYFGSLKKRSILLHLAIVMSGSRIIRMFLQDKNSRNIVHGSGPIIFLSQESVGPSICLLTIRNTLLVRGKEEQYQTTATLRLRKITTRFGRIFLGRKKQIQKIIWVKRYK